MRGMKNPQPLLDDLNNVLGTKFKTLEKAFDDLSSDENSLIDERAKLIKKKLSLKPLNTHFLELDNKLKEVLTRAEENKILSKLLPSETSSIEENRLMANNRLDDIITKILGKNRS